MENTKFCSSMFDVKRPFQLCCLGDLSHPRLFPSPVCSSLWQTLIALTSETSRCLTETHALFLQFHARASQGLLSSQGPSCGDSPAMDCLDLNSPQRLWRESPWPIYSPHLTLLWSQHHVGGTAKSSHQSGMNPQTLEPCMEQCLLVIPS